MDSSRLHGGKVLQMSEREGENEREGRFLEGFSAFNCRSRLGLGCTGNGRDWASWASLWGGIVH
jgi:hypothetical protein